MAYYFVGWEYYMDTGYYLDNNKICDAGGFSQARVSESGYIYTPDGYTFCWIWGGSCW